MKYLVLQVKVTQEVCYSSMKLNKLNACLESGTCLPTVDVHVP